MQYTLLSFPELRLSTRDGHKLRGYFGNLFQQHSNLLHNHDEEGGFLFRYPLVQYKIIRGVPYVVGLKEGAKLMLDIFTEVTEIQIGETVFPLHEKRIESRIWNPALAETPAVYQFETLWMPLNPENYRTYQLLDPEGRLSQLEAIASRNIQTVFKAAEVFLPEDQRIWVKLNVFTKTTQFKNQSMLAFTGRMSTNASLPDFIGIGKSVSRGFGAIKRINTWNS